VKIAIKFQVKGRLFMVELNRTARNVMAPPINLFDAGLSAPPKRFFRSVLVKFQCIIETIRSNFSSVVTYLRGWSTAPASVGEQFVYWGVPFREK
jgi:hypothetical protein